MSVPHDHRPAPGRAAWRVAGLALLTAVAALLAGAPAAAQSFGTEYVTFVRGELRVIATQPDTRVELIDLDTGALSTDFGANPRVLAAAGDSWEAQSPVTVRGVTQSHVRVRASDALGGGAERPVVVWTGFLEDALRHPPAPPDPASGPPNQPTDDPWMSYLPAVRSATAAAGAEVGREFWGFTSRDLIVIALRGASPTSIVIEDLITNVDFDDDDDVVLTPASPTPLYADSEIEAWMLSGFEDDTIHVTSNVDISVLAGFNPERSRDWTSTPPSHAAGDDGIELGTLFYTFVQSGLSIFPTQDDTHVTITDLTDAGVAGLDDSTSVTLVNGHPANTAFDFWTVVTSGFNPSTLLTRGSAPLVTVLTNEPDAFENDLVKVESDKPVLLYVGPITSDVREFADVACSVPTGTLSRLTYAYAQNGGAEDLQLFAFDPATNVVITSLTTSIAPPTFHDYQIPAPTPYVDVAPTGFPAGFLDRYWQSGLWRGELLRIESDRPITVIAGDYDVPHFGAFIPFVRTTPLLPPVAVAAVEPAEGCPEDTLRLLGVASFDQDDAGPPPDIVACAWDVDVAVDSDGNGVPDDDVDLVGCDVLQTPADCASRVARLTVTDNEGEQDTDDVAYRVGDDAPPVLTCPGDLAVECGPDHEQQFQDWLALFDCTGTCGEVTILQGADAFSFDDFSDLSAWQLNGSTAAINASPVIHGGQAVLRLTNDLSQSGSAFLTEAVSLAVDVSFSARFEFQITDNQPCLSDTGADGIVFVVQTVSNTAGGLGGGIGYAGLTNSLGVELDTWDNGAPDADDGNHVGIDLDGSVFSNPLVPVSPDFNDGSEWTAWVDYDGASDLLDVRLVRGAGAARPASPLTSRIVDLPVVLGSTIAFFGFTSGTGCAGGDHDIRNFELRTSFDPIDCSGTGNRTVTYVCTDGCGREASCTRVFTTEDTTPPTLTVGGIDPCYPSLAAAEAAALAAADAGDACDPTPSLTVASVLDGCEATMTVTATDECANSASVDVTATVDASPPAIVVPATLMLECRQPEGVTSSDPDVVAWLAEATASDDCGVVFFEHDAPAFLPAACAGGATTMVTWTARDGCGAETTRSAEVLVVDSTPPDLTAPGPLVLECDGPGGIAADDPRLEAWLLSASATDVCSAVGIADDAPAFFASGCAPDGHATVVTFTATDDCGNATSLSSTVTVTDSTPPDLTVPTPLLLECDGPGGIAADDPRLEAWLLSASATDVCSAVGIADDAPAFFASGCAPDGNTTVVTFTATDDCGNATSLTSTVTVTDTTPPVLTVPIPLLLECDGPGGIPGDDPRILTWLGLASASDACGAPGVSSDAPGFYPTGCGPDGHETIVTFTATDACGLQTVLPSSVTVVDTTPPTVEPSDEQLACLWPPNHWYVCFSAEDFEALVRPLLRDACDSGPLTWRLAGCASDQPDEAPDASAPGWNGDGETTDDCLVSPDGSQVCLRAERAGTGPGDHGLAGPSAQEGRRYGLSVVATDACGNTSDPVGVGHVHVPHDQSPEATDCLQTTQRGLRPNELLPF